MSKSIVESDIKSDLRSQTIAGIFWSILMQVGQESVRFSIAVVLARLLTPDDFGLIGMIIVFTGFAQLFVEMGFGSAIIQKQNIEQRHLSSVFWLNVASGLFLTAIVAGCSPLIGSFYGEPILVPLTIAISANFAIGSVNTVHNVLLQKKMDFKKLAVIRTTSLAIAGVIAMGMALKNYGVWSLVANSLIATAVSTTVMWYLSDWRPGLIWDVRAVKELFGFSFHLLGSRISNYWMSNIDNLLIGKYVSSSALGVYGRAFNLMLLPITQISWVLGRVMFPALSVIQQDKKKVKHVFLKGSRAIALVSFPMMAGLFVVARSFVLALYGPKWEGVILILQIFCIEGLRRSIGTTVGWIYLSQGRTDLQLWWGLGSGLVRVASIAIGLHWGAMGVAVAIVISSYLVLWYPGWMIPGRLVNLTFGEMLRNLSGPFFCSALMAAGVFAVDFLLPNAWAHWMLLAVQVPIGIAIYFFFIAGFRLRAYREAKEILVELLQKRREESHF